MERVSRRLSIPAACVVLATACGGDGDATRDCGAGDGGLIDADADGRVVDAGPRDVEVEPDAAPDGDSREDGGSPDGASDADSGETPPPGPIVPRQAHGLPVVILKIDDMNDFMGDTDARRTAWLDFVDYLDRAGIPANIGLLGNAFGGTSETRLQTSARLTEWMEAGIVECWNHSMCYCPEEFEEGTSDYDSQYAIIEEAQDRFETSLGIRPIGFGSGGNLRTDDTTRVMMDHPDMRVWFFGEVMEPNEKLLSLNTRIWGLNNLDPDRLLSVESFMSAFSEHLGEPYIVLQGHAGKWPPSHLALFEATMDELRRRYPDVVFMTISEYLVHCGGVLD